MVDGCDCPDFLRFHGVGDTGRVTMGPILTKAADQGELCLWNICKNKVWVWVGKGSRRTVLNVTMFIPVQILSKPVHKESTLTYVVCFGSKWIIYCLNGSCVDLICLIFNC